MVNETCDDSSLKSTVPLKTADWMRMVAHHTNPLGMWPLPQRLTWTSVGSSDLENAPLYWICEELASLTIKNRTLKKF